MCFSATASFTASAVLTATGVATLTKVKSKREIPLALIPLFFGIQQFTEGITWLSTPETTQICVSTYSFLFFAYIVWPFLVPLAYYLVEPRQESKKILKALIAVGSFVSLTLLAITITHKPVALNLNDHIAYRFDTPVATDFAYYNYIFTVAYLVAVCGVGLFTKHKYLKIFSLTSFIGFIIAFTAYYNNWKSIWCFIAAILSVIIYQHFRVSSKKDI